MAATTVRRETSWRRRWKPDLGPQLWRPFTVSCTNYLLKSMFVEQDCSYELCLCDRNTFWYEKVESDQFRTRAKELNPNFEAKSSYMLNVVQKNIEEQHGETTFTISPDTNSEDKLVLKMKTKLQAGIPFVWEFYFSLGEKNMVGSHLIEPMLAMIVELNRQQSELYAILRKKDQEIADYKESGIRLSRKSLATAPFDEAAFRSRMVLSQGFEDAVQYASTRGFSETSGELYKQIMIKRAWLEVKDAPEPDDDQDIADDMYESVAVGLAGEPSAPSWTDMLPPSLLGEGEVPSTSSPRTSPRTSPRKPPVTSPTKSSGLASSENSPSKDVELQRREALQKRLAEETERKKRKKPQIKI